jgi:hypothetical protein
MSLHPPPSFLGAPFLFPHGGTYNYGPLLRPSKLQGDWTIRRPSEALRSPSEASERVVGVFLTSSTMLNNALSRDMRWVLVLKLLLSCPDKAVLAVMVDRPSDEAVGC